MTTIVILGGYGNTGREVVRLLLEHTDAQVVLAGRDADKAARAAAGWNGRFPGTRVRSARADAGQAGSLAALFAGADLVVVASSSSAHVKIVAAAALEAGIDYMDPQFSRRKLAALEEMRPQIEAAGRCFITDAGFHPGLPAALVRYAARRFDRLLSARVGSVIQVDWSGLEFSPDTLAELVEEFLDYQALHFKDGRWVKMGWLESFRPVYMNFGHGFGRRYTMPMFLEELRPLPEMVPGLQETGFFVGGFNWVVDWLILPVAMGWLKVSPHRGLRPVGRMLLWGLKRFTRPPYGTLLQMEAQGVSAGQQQHLTVAVYHPDGYVLTAAPMVACLLQILDGSARRPGLHLQALLADPDRLLTDLQRMGVEVRAAAGPGQGPGGHPGRSDP
ncbi:MAG: hypothetical protein A2Y93_00320 [Chloroflexi bacterium RBG_13_68_17]|nr:MAG: hypothetical protein A2Y93_00320 [Chloroflexi bacterium RBG_13_68_17]